jgi:hypothetical protein
MATELENVGNVPAAWPIIFVSMPSFTRGRVEMYFISGPYGRARARVDTLIFCDHYFDCHFVTLACNARAAQ